MTEKEHEQPINQENQKKLDEMKKILLCQKDLKCFKEGFTDMCKAREGGPLGTIYCMEENSPECLFSMTLGFKYICKCPLRNYALKELNK